MSRSLPKPKIIYKNLQDIIRNSSYTKNNPTTPTNTNKSIKNIQKKYSSSLNHHSLKKSISRHSLNSKQKINMPRKQKMLIKQIFKSQLEDKDQRYQLFCNKVEKIYQQMQQMLSQTKNQFIKKMKQNPLSYDHNLQQLQKMSKCLKQLFNFFKQNTNTEDDILSTLPTSTVLTQISSNNQNISKLSIENQKRRKNNRINGQKIRQYQKRKPSVYELVLMKKK